MATKFKCNDGIYTVLRNGKAVAISATAGEAVEAIAADAEEIACPPEPPARLGLRITTTPGGLPPFDLAAWNTFLTCLQTAHLLQTFRLQATRLLYMEVQV